MPGSWLQKKNYSTASACRKYAIWRLILGDLEKKNKTLLMIGITGKSKLKPFGRSKARFPTD
jgi:hypothetical protein